MDAPGSERNVLGGVLEPCGTDPMTGFTRDGSCRTGPEDVGSHTVCVVVSTEFLALQRRLGNDLGTPRPEYGFPGLLPGDRWCVVAVRWRQAAEAGVPAGVVLAATNARALEVVPLELLRAHRRRRPRRRLLPRGTASRQRRLSRDDRPRPVELP